MVKFREAVEHLEFAELQKIKSDLDTGAMHMKRIIEAKIQKKEAEHGHVCNVCMSSIDQFSVNTFTLVFGPDNFKRKASFCGMDCLKYFIANLENLKKGLQQESKSEQKSE